MSPDAGRQRREDRIEVLDDLLLAADHHAVAALQAPDAAAGSDVHVVDSLCGKFLRPPDVVDVVGIAAVDEDVARLQKRDEIVDALVDDRGRHHQPDHPGLCQLFDEVGKGAAPTAFSATSSFTAFAERS